MKAVRYRNEAGHYAMKAMLLLFGATAWGFVLLLHSVVGAAPVRPFSAFLLFLMLLGVNQNLEAAARIARGRKIAR